MAGSLLPPNATAAEKALEGATARIGDVPVPIATLYNPATCPAALLPWLAAASSVIHWNPAWPEDIKRRVIAESFKVNSALGYFRGIDLALEAVGVEVELTDWHEKTPAGTPGTFSAVALVNENLHPGAPLLNDATFKDIVQTIDAAKRKSQHYDIAAGLALDGGAAFGHGLAPAQHVSGTLTAAPMTSAGPLAVAQACAPAPLVNAFMRPA